MIFIWSAGQYFILNYNGKSSEKWYIYAAKSHQSCLSLCDPIDSSPLGSSVPGILQARIMEWIAISFSNAWKWKVKVKSCSCVQLFATPWTEAHQAPPPIGLSRQEHWSGVPFPSPMPESEKGKGVHRKYNESSEGAASKLAWWSEGVLRDRELLGQYLLRC